MARRRGRPIATLPVWQRPYTTTGKKCNRNGGGATPLGGRDACLDVATTGVDRKGEKEPRSFYTDVCGNSKALNAPAAAAATTGAGVGSSSVQHRRSDSGCRWREGGGRGALCSVSGAKQVSRGYRWRQSPRPSLTSRIESRRRPSMCSKKEVEHPRGAAQRCATITGVARPWRAGVDWQAALSRSADGVADSTSTRRQSTQSDAAGTSLRHRRRPSLSVQCGSGVGHVAAARSVGVVVEKHGRPLPAEPRTAHNHRGQKRKAGPRGLEGRGPLRLLPTRSGLSSPLMRGARRSRCSESNLLGPGARTGSTAVRVGGAPLEPQTLQHRPAGDGSDRARKFKSGRLSNGLPPADVSQIRSGWRN